VRLPASLPRTNSRTSLQEAEVNTDINRIFLSGLTNRWHANPWLATTTDRIDGHQGRVARLITALWPDASRDLIIAALTHDDGESVTGDIPFTTKKTERQKNAEAAARVMIWGRQLPSLLTPDADRLIFCDRLDAAMWMMHHAPECQHDRGWPEAIEWIKREANILGVEVSI